nr:hypothetical protein B0A51_15390 [Rachicladosporium sp. CCFEE 5018]
MSDARSTGLDSGIVRIERPALSDRSDTVPDLASKIKTDKRRLPGVLDDRASFIDTAHSTLGSGRATLRRMSFAKRSTNKCNAYFPKHNLYQYSKVKPKNNPSTSNSVIVAHAATAAQEDRRLYRSHASLPLPNCFRLCRSNARLLPPNNTRLFQSNARMMPPNRKALAQSTQGDQSDKGSGTDSAKKQIDNGAIEEEIEGGPAQDGAIENGIGGSMRDDSAKVGDREIVSGMKDKSKAPVKDGRRETSNHFDLGCDADVMERAVVHSDFDSEGIVYDT